MACLESNFFGNTVSLTILSFTPARTSPELPQTLHYHRAITGLLMSHSLWSQELNWMLLSALTCIPAPQSPAHFMAPDIPRCPPQPKCQAWASRQSKTVASTLLHASHTPASLTPVSPNLFYSELLARH